MRYWGDIVILPACIVVMRNFIQNSELNSKLRSLFNIKYEELAI